MSAETADPGLPPERGIAVQAEGDGFYARVYPRPPVDWARNLPALGGFAGVGLALAWWAGEATLLRVEVFLGILLFGGLLLAFRHGQGFVPVEISATGETLYWGGDRVPLAEVGTCRPEGDRLVLRGHDGWELGAVAHLRPEVARWVGLAVEASRPG